MSTEQIIAHVDEIRDLQGAKASPLWLDAVTFLRGWFSEDVQRQVRAAIAKDPTDWIVPYHLHWGMGVRNALREHGFSEQAFGVLNLDNVYVALIEAAVQP